MNLSRRQLIADYYDRYGITPDRDEPPPERAPFDPVLAARIREGAVRMEADRERMRHRCETCPDCIHDGNKCCGCYDGACCQTMREWGAR